MRDNRLSVSGGAVFAFLDGDQVADAADNGQVRRGFTGHGDAVVADEETLKEGLAEPLTTSVVGHHVDVVDVGYLLDQTTKSRQGRGEVTVDFRKTLLDGVTLHREPIEPFANLLARQISVPESVEEPVFPLTQGGKFLAEVLGDLLGEGLLLLQLDVDECLQCGSVDVGAAQRGYVVLDGLLHAAGREVAHGAVAFDASTADVVVVQLSPATPVLGVDEAAANAPLFAGIAEQQPLEVVVQATAP